MKVEIWLVHWSWHHQNQHAASWKPQCKSACWVPGPGPASCSTQTLETLSRCLHRMTLFHTGSHHVSVIFVCVSLNEGPTGNARIDSWRLWHKHPGCGTCLGHEISTETEGICGSLRSWHILVFSKTCVRMFLSCVQTIHKANGSIIFNIQ